MKNRHKPLPPKSVLNEVLRYDPATGGLFWNARGAHMFDERGTVSPEHRAAAFNAKNAGQPAMMVKNGDHFAGRLFGKCVLAHRVVWKMVHGTEPDKIDHINGDGRDNRIENLRSVSHAENMKNKTRPRGSKNPYPGVHRSNVGTWYVRIRMNSVDHHIGTFSDLRDAVAARKDAEQRFGFHENHGRRTNRG